MGYILGSLSFSPKKTKKNGQEYKILTDERKCLLKNNLKNDENYLPFTVYHSFFNQTDLIVAVQNPIIHLVHQPIH